MFFSVPSVLGADADQHIRPSPQDEVCPLLSAGSSFVLAVVQNPRSEK